MICRKLLALVYIVLCLCVPAQCMTIAEAKLLRDGASVTLKGKVVTCYDPWVVYIEEDDRSSGIRVENFPEGITPGMRVDVSGTISTPATERSIRVTTATVSGTGSIAPLGIPIASIVGGDWCYNAATGVGQKGAPDRTGLNNSGLLVRVWGTPSNADGSDFLLNDGANRSVRCMAHESVLVYPAARFAVIEGISRLIGDIPCVYITRMDAIPPSELVSVPAWLTGDRAPKVGTSCFYTGGPAVCTRGHDVEYQIDWGDGTSTDWSEGKSAYHTWTTTGGKIATITARCKTSHVSQQSAEVSVYPVANTNYWERTSGPAGCKPGSFVRTSKGHIFAGAGRIYRSVDNGQHWVYLSGATSSALAVNKQDHIFAGEQGGVYRSTDDGDHWTLFSDGLPVEKPCYAVAVTPNGTVFAAYDYYGVYRSTDNGEHWQLMNGLPYWPSCSSFAITSSGTVPAGTAYAGTYGKGVYRSTDSGGTWTQINTGLGNLDVYSLAIGPDGSVLAGTSSGAYRSVNDGANWSKIGGIYSYRIFGFGVSPSGTTFAAGDNYIYKSTDYGVTWSAVITPRSYQDFRGLIAFDGTVMVGTSGYTILRSTNNGATWTEPTDGILGIKTEAIIQGSSGRLFAGGYGIVYTSDDEGATWISRTSGLSKLPVYALARNSAGTIFAGTWGEKVYRSTDNGVSWSSAGSGISGGNVLALEVNSRNVIFVGTDSSGVFKSTDGGEHWVAANSGLTQLTVRAMTVGPNDALYVGTYSGGVFRSTDDAASWTLLGTPASSVKDILVKPDGTILAATSSAIYRSTDNGSTWSRINTGIKSQGSCSALAMDVSGRLFAGDDDGVYVSSNNGSSWSKISTGLEGNSVIEICVAGNGRIFAATSANGVYRSRVVPAP